MRIACRHRSASRLTVSSRRRSASLLPDDGAKDYPRGQEALLLCQQRELSDVVDDRAPPSSFAPCAPSSRRCSSSSSACR